MMTSEGREKTREGREEDEREVARDPSLRCRMVPLTKRTQKGLTRTSRTVQTYIHAYRQKYIHICVYICTYTYIHAYIHINNYILFFVL